MEKGNNKNPPPFSPSGDPKGKPDRAPAFQKTKTKRARTSWKGRPRGGGYGRIRAKHFFFPFPLENFGLEAFFALVFSSRAIPPQQNLFLFGQSGVPFLSPNLFPSPQTRGVQGVLSFWGKRVQGAAKIIGGANEFLYELHPLCLVYFP